MTPARASSTRSASSGDTGSTHQGCCRTPKSSRTSCRPPHPGTDDSQPSGGDPVTTELETNKDIVRAFIAAWNGRRFGDFDQLMGEDAVLSVGGTTVPCNPAATRGIAQEWTTAFPDWQFDPSVLVAEGDLVVAH